MRVLTALLAAACFAAGCRGRAEAEVPEEPEAEEAEVPADPSPPPPVTIVQEASVTTVERRWTESSSSLEFTPLAPTPRSAPAPSSPAPSRCCRTCHSGRACGNTCIAANRECHTPPGCACDG